MIYTEEFVTKNADDINWRIVSWNIDLKKFSTEFFERFKDKIVWDELTSNETITTEFTHKYQERLGFKAWFKDGQFHRLDGPAFMRNDGSCVWFKDGCYHRKGGPAIVYRDGIESWYENGCLIDAPKDK